ncbi:hypothetical protein FACS1894156_1350 [Bacteroidia bacterium]|nr:hypothetical protein FACS1894156_1350 [Bacteroidia bacterium]
MVIYSDRAIQDLEDILYGLVTWEKHPLSFEHAKRYVDEIEAEADTICKKTFHTDTYYPSHKLYGDKVHLYRKRKQTVWYIIYNWEEPIRMAFVTKIINNYLTTDTIENNEQL